MEFLIYLLLYACAPLIDGLGHAMRCSSRPGTYLSQASCVIVSGFRAALDFDKYPLSNLIRPRCAEWAKPGRGTCKPVLIMHNYWLFRLFYAYLSNAVISAKSPHIFYCLVALKRLVSLTSHLVAYSARIVADKQTYKQTNR